jgi:hypothetical protein
VTDFTDDEGCFLVNIRFKPKFKVGYSIELVFKIALHSKDKVLLENIFFFFGPGGGTVTNRGSDCIQF